MHKKRFYRDWVYSDLVSFEAVSDETDLFILAEKDLKKQALFFIKEARAVIESFISKHPDFKDSLAPLNVNGKTPELIDQMLNASRKAGVGPMAAVAGAISSHVGNKLLKHSQQVIVENGGDIFIKSLKDRNFLIYAGKSKLSGKISFTIKTDKTPIGVCTSSGSVGHSLSFGKADAVTVVSKDTALADAAATAICNRVKSEKDIKQALDFSKTIDGVDGCVIIHDESLGSIGDIELK